MLAFKLQSTYQIEPRVVHSFLDGANAERNLVPAEPDIEPAELEGSLVRIAVIREINCGGLLWVNRRLCRHLFGMSEAGGEADLNGAETDIAALLSLVEGRTNLDQNRRNFASSATSGQPCIATRYRQMSTVLTRCVVCLTGRHLFVSDHDQIGVRRNEAL